MKDVTIGTFVQLFETQYGCILDNKAQFITTYNTYRHKMKPHWGRWTWEAYEHFVRTPNHTRTQYGEGISAKMTKAIGLLPSNIINKVITHE